MLAPAIGHNTPPSEIDIAKEAMAELSAWLKANPVVQTAVEAKEAGGWMGRTLRSLKAARDERDTKTKPHNDALKVIREVYDLVREKTGTNRGGALQAAYDETKRRLFCYTEEERRRREAEAEIARQKAAEALRIAQEAAFRRDEAIEDASVGAESDVGGLIVNANQTHREAAKAVRQLAVAERDTNVRVPSMMGGRSIAPRERRVLVVASVPDAVKAIAAIGLTDKIRTAIVQSAKDFEDAYGELPEGVTETFERSL